MNNVIKRIVNLTYSFLEQLVFLLALICGLLAWSAFDSITVAIFIFIAICVLFWAIPNIIKKINK